MHANASLPLAPKRAMAQGGKTGHAMLSAAQAADEMEYSGSNAAIASFWNRFGEVMTVDHVIERLNAAAPGVAA